MHARSRHTAEQPARRALLVATVLSHVAQFHQPAIGLLKQAGFEVHVAARNNLDEKPGLTLAGVDRLIDVPFERSPLTPRNFAAALRLSQLLRETDYELIHCNTPVAGLLTRLLGQRSRRRGALMVYTAHGFHFFRGAPLKNWLLYYPLEWMAAIGTDVLITINSEDYRRASRFPARSVLYVPGVGLDLPRFKSEQPIMAARRELGLPKNACVVLSVGELNHNKNHATIIRALAIIPPSNVYYLICGNGPLRDSLERLTAELGLSDRVQFLGYRRDIPKVLAASDVFCLPSLREGLPVAAMEAMASAKPILSSRIRGVVDLVDADLGGILISDADDVQAFACALKKLAQNPVMRSEMGSHNAERILDFSVGAVEARLIEAYGLSLSHPVNPK